MGLRTLGFPGLILNRARAVGAQLTWVSWAPSEHLDAGVGICPKMLQGLRYRIRICRLAILLLFSSSGLSDVADGQSARGDQDDDQPNRNPSALLWFAARKDFFKK